MGLYDMISGAVTALFEFGSSIIDLISTVAGLMIHGNFFNTFFSLFIKLGATIPIFILAVVNAIIFVFTNLVFLLIFCEAIILVYSMRFSDANSMLAERVKLYYGLFNFILDISRFILEVASIITRVVLDTVFGVANVIANLVPFT